MLANVTIADLLRPIHVKWARLYEIVLVVIGSLLIGVCARIAVWLPFSPVPITGQTFAVLMAGALFGARRGCLTVIVYVIEGTIGLPVFAAGQGGLTVLLGPRGGYLVGFIAAAYITGLLAERGWNRRVGWTILAMIFGSVTMYAYALPWLCCFMGVNKTVLIAGLYPFVIGDLLKIILAALILPLAWGILQFTGLVDAGE
jgi:biotin transport system substrate-specific component